MGNFLDAIPFSTADPDARALRDFLASIYWSADQIEPVTTPAGVPRQRVRWSGDAEAIWTSVLEQAARQGPVRAFVQKLIELVDAAVATRLREFLADAPVVPSPSRPLADEEWRGEPEKQTAAEPTLLDITFLERGLELSQGVVRLLTTGRDGRMHYGTGFLVKPDLVLTNHHVLVDEDDPERPKMVAAEAWFGYVRDFVGKAERPYVTVKADATTIQGNEEHDWAVIRIDPEKVPDGAVVISTKDEDLGKVGVDSRVYIVQHPQGGPKQIGMIHNVVRHVDEDVVQYLTDTLGGSSGAPVFDESWRLIAVHHQGKTVDLGGGTKEVRNQGRRIERVLEGMRAAALL